MWYFQGKYIEVSFDFKGDTTGGAISNCKFSMILKHLNCFATGSVSISQNNEPFRTDVFFYIWTTVNFYVKQATPSLLRWQLAKTFWRNFSRSFRLFPTFRRPATNACKRSFGPNAKKGLIFNGKWKSWSKPNLRNAKIYWRSNKKQNNKELCFDCNFFSWFPF